jgi:hypothetical protein
MLQLRWVIDRALIQQAHHFDIAVPNPTIHFQRQLMQCVLQISLQLWDGQIPTVMLLENGKEMARLPPARKQTQHIAKTTLRRVRCLQIDATRQRLLEIRHTACTLSSASVNSERMGAKLGLTRSLACSKTSSQHLVLRNLLPKQLASPSPRARKLDASRFHNAIYMHDDDWGCFALFTVMHCAVPLL